jgi:hypothetical protein
MWLLHMEQTDGVAIKHARNRREYRLREWAHFSVDGYCAETNTVYEFFECFVTAAPVIRFVPSSPQMETCWQLETNRQWLDLSR